MKSGLLVIAAVCCALAFAPRAVHASTTTVDLLGGLGDFEWSIVVDEENPILCPAIGWSKEVYTSGTGQDYNYGIVIDTTNGFSGEDNCQKMYVENQDSGGTDLYLRANFALQWDTSVLEPGDVVTFKLDNIKMADYSGLNVHYYLMTDFGTDAQSKELTASSTPFSDYVTREIVSGKEWFRVFVRIVVSGDIGSYKPAIYIDGAHLYVQRSGSPLLEEWPVVHDRNIKTMQLWTSPAVADVKKLAEDYDYVFFKKDYPWMCERIRYYTDYDPDLKVVLYEAAGVDTDRRESASEDIDSIYWYPLSFLHILNNHTGWLYSYDPEDEDPDSFQSKLDDYYGEGNDPRDNEEWIRINYMFNFPEYISNYYLHIDDEYYREEWLDAALDQAERFNADGIFMDGVGARTSSLQWSPHPPIRYPYECQKFLHAVDSAIRNEGLEVHMNCCGMHLSDDPAPTLDWPEGVIYFDPTWTAGGDYPTPDYANNSATNTPDFFFQECALKGWNGYDKGHWLDCLDDMDTIADINDGLGQNDPKKYMVMNICNGDADPPAYGLDGWIHFGLCSYLLGQNQWTVVSFRDNTDEDDAPVTIDYSVTTDFAAAAGARQQYQSYQYVQSRCYYGDDSGAKGGIAVVNADSTARPYTTSRDGEDELGRFVPRGTNYGLQANTGRLLTNLTDYKYISTITNPPEGAVFSSEEEFPCDITGVVVANRSGLSMPSTVQVKIDDGSWVNCNVNSETGAFTYTWQSASQGKHTVRSRVYVSSEDYEPEKYPRNCYVFDGSLNYCSTVADALALADDAVVSISGSSMHRLCVTATNDSIADSIYVQDRSLSGSMVRGVRVYYPDSAPKIVEVGDTVDVAGKLDTVDGQRCIVDAVVRRRFTTTDDPYLFLMPNRAVGGGDWEYNSQTGAGQRGITDAYGWNNTGNLICTWGVVDSIDSTSFYIDDGAGVNVKVVVPSGVGVPDDEDYVSVTGVSSCEVSGSDLNRVVRVRTEDDIKTHAPAYDNTVVDLYYYSSLISLVSVPIDPDPETVFDLWDLGSDILSRYDLMTQTWIDYNPAWPATFGNMTVDCGYSFIPDGSGNPGQYAGEISYKGMYLGDAANGGTQYMCISLPGEQEDTGGLHVFGYPFSGNYAVNSQGQYTGDRVLFSDGADVYDWDDASSASWVDDDAPYWDPAENGYDYLSYSGGDDDTFRFGLGYHITTYEDNIVMLLEVP